MLWTDLQPPQRMYRMRPWCLVSNFQSYDEAVIIDQMYPQFLELGGTRCTRGNLEEKLFWVAIAWLYRRTYEYKVSFHPGSVGAIRLAMPTDNECGSRNASTSGADDALASRTAATSCSIDVLDVLLLLLILPRSSISAELYSFCSSCPWFPSLQSKTVALFDRGV